MKQQLELFESQRLIKEEEIKYYEVIDSKGERTIRKVTDTKKHFHPSTGTRHNPSCSNHVEIL